MAFEPLIPPPLWLALAIAGVALLVWYGLRPPEVITRRRWALVLGLMGTALGLVLVILLNPIRVSAVPPIPGKPLLTVLVDASASMATPDAAGATTRYVAASKMAADLASKLHDRFDVRVRTFSGMTATADAADLLSRKADGPRTDLGAGIADNIDEDHPQGQAVALLSDGIQNVGNGADPVLDAVRRAKALDVPIYTRTLGAQSAGMDLAVSLRSPQELALAGQRVPVTVQVTQVGAAGIHANVSLLYDGKEVGQQQVLLAHESTDVRFWVTQPKTGLYPYEARVEPVPGEITQANNSATYLLRVIDQPFRVLVLEGKPYWDSKFLVRTLAAVPAVELDSIVRIADGRLMQRTISRHPPATQPGATRPASPDAEQWKIVGSAADELASADYLRQYQVIVLGRDAESFLNDGTLTAVQNWIAHDGGALVCYRGAPVAQVNQRLARLLPVKWTPAREARFRMRLTEQGRDLHWFGGTGSEEDSVLLGLPTLASSAQVDRSKPLAVVLATSVSPGGGESPAVVYQPYGSGRAVVIEGAGMWRWAFLPPQFQQREEVYSELWHSLLRWLTSGVGLLPGQRATLRADKVSFATIEPATATLLMREEAAKGAVPSVELLNPPPGVSRTYASSPVGGAPGTFRASFGMLPEGRYQARVPGGGSEDVAARTVFDVRVVSQEQLDLQVRPDLMSRIASDSGGGVLDADPAEQLAAQFRQHLDRSRPPRFERTTAWDRPWALLLVFGLWGVSWLVRRSGGLV